MTRRAAGDGEAGAIAPLVAILLASLCGFAGLAVDLGLVQYQRRALQASVDAAALSAARAPTQAQAIATNALARHGSVTGAASIATGRYVDDPAVPLGARFDPAGATPHDAVRVTAQREVGLGLSRALLGAGSMRVGATAVAEHRPLAAFSIGSGAGSLDAGILNQMLGGLLGGAVSLSAASYTGLLGAKVELFGMSDALATRLGLGAGSYRQLLGAQASLTQFFGASASAMGSGGGAAATSLDILSQTAMAGRSFAVSQLLTLGLHEPRHIGDLAADRSYADLRVNALDVVTAAAGLGGSNSAIALPGSINLPGLATIGVRVMAVEPPQASPRGAFGLGPVGATADTSQIRLLLSLRLLTLVNGGVVNLPLLIEVAPATAELRGISCQGEPRTDAAVTIGAATGLARAQIGQVTTAQFDAASTNFGILPPAPILSVTLRVLSIDVDVSVRLRAGASIGAGSGDLAFTAADIAAGTARTMSSSALAGSLVRSLGGNLVLSTEVDVSLVPNFLLSTVEAALSPLLTTLLSGVTNALLPVLDVLDGTVDQVLAAVGVRLGSASIRTTGVRCGIAALVL